MIKKFNTFEKISESGKYVDIKNKYHTLGEYVEHLYNIIDDKDSFSQILGKFLKIPTKKYNSASYKVGDYILIEYWFQDLLTPVKIVDKQGRTYKVTHNIEESEIQNAPDEKITKGDIVSHYRKTEDNKVEKNIPTDIRIANSVNLLNEYDQMLLVKKLQDTFSVSETNHFEIEEMKDMTVLGQTGFNSFLKVLTSLNLPNIKINKEHCPTDFFSIFMTEKLNKERLITILKRFRSMDQLSDILSQSNDVIMIYFGLSLVANKLVLEYGIIKGEKRIVVGEFKINQKNWVNLKERSSKPLKSLQEQIINVELNDLKKLMKIKQDLTNFSPGYYHEKSNPYIEDNVLVQGYFGTGKWDKGTITSNSFDEIKSSFKKWVLTQKWGKIIVFRTIPDKFWVKIEIKLVEEI